MLNKTKYLFITAAILFLHNFLLFAQHHNSNIKQLTNLSEIVIAGKVTEQASRWDESKSMILTDVVINVYEVLKGHITSNFVTISHPGGEIGDLGEIYTHIPTFQDGEEVLVFAKGTKNKGKYVVSSGDEGKITIVTDKKSGQKITTSNKVVEQIKKEVRSFVAE